MIFFSTCLLVFQKLRAAGRPRLLIALRLLSAQHRQAITPPLPPAPPSSSLLLSVALFVLARAVLKNSKFSSSFVSPPPPKMRRLSPIRRCFLSLARSKITEKSLGVFWRHRSYSVSDSLIRRFCKMNCPHRINGPLNAAGAFRHCKKRRGCVKKNAYNTYWGWLQVLLGFFAQDRRIVWILQGTCVRK